MEASPLHDAVAKHYERWVYPEPIIDLPGWLEHNWQWFDPSHAHQQFWPDQSYNPKLTILIAGCGTNQAAVFAYTNPEARVVAVDVSQTSLDHQRHLKDTYGLSNLELHQLPVEQIDRLGLTFDLIVSTGVLHHLACPETGLKVLAGCLRRDGVIAIMVYARYGRLGVEILQALFRELGLEQNSSSLGLVKEALASLPLEHPVQSYLSMAPDLRFDAGLVDTFLHGRDRSYSVEDCLALVASAGLVFQDWFFKAPYYPPDPEGNGFFRAVSALPQERQWPLMERLYTRNACHYFTACRRARQLKSYRIAFDEETACRYVPSFRYRCALDNCEAIRPGWRMPLDSLQQALLARVDGCSTIAEITAAVSDAGHLPPQPKAGHLALACKAFERLWRGDFVAMGITPGAG